VTRLSLVLLALGTTPLVAQSLDPRSYVNTPVGMQFVIGGYVYSEGNVLFDPSVPIENAELTLHGPVAAYARALDLWGLSGKVDAVAGFVCADGNAEVDGEYRERHVCGLTDPVARISVNFLGAPALRLPAFAKYRQDLLVGASLRVAAPLGQYDPDKLVNIGTKRWSFKPEVGVSKAIGRTLLEFLGSATFYTTNPDFYVDRVLTQAPLYAGQINVVYSLRSGIWAALGGTLYGGGRTTINGVESDAWQQDSRLGLTVAIPISRHNSLKLYGSTGVSTRTGTDFDTVGLAWQFRWGGGM
jgi:hypothetical protein